MTRRAHHHVTGWVALLALILNGLLPQGIVVCADAHGARLEVVCGKDDHGACETGTPAVHEHDDGLQEADSCCGAPCKDISIRADTLAIRGGEYRLAISGSAHLAEPSPPLMLPVSPVQRQAVRIDCKPPPSANHLRSIVLLI
jgi:hypothetical protein